MKSAILDRLNTLRDEPVKPAGVDVAAAMRAGRGRLRIRRAALGGAVLVTVAAVLGAASTVVHSATLPPALPAATPTPSTSSAPFAGTCEERTLPVPHGESGVAAALATDNSGRFVVGIVLINNHDQGVLWRDGKILFAHTSGRPMVFTAVNSSGIAVGHDTAGTGALTSYVYTNGELTPLASPDSAEALAINDAGAIVGFAGMPSRRYPVMWANPSSNPVRLPIPADAVGVAKTIDNAGNIAGDIDQSGGGNRNQLTIWRADGSRRILPLPPIKDAIAVRVFSINDGAVLAQTQVKGVEHHSGPLVTYNVSSDQWTILHQPTGMVIGGSAHLVAMNQQIAWSPEVGTIKLPTINSGAAATGPRTANGTGTSIVGTDGGPAQWICH